MYFNIYLSPFSVQALQTNPLNILYLKDFQQFMKQHDCCLRGFFFFDLSLHFLFFLVSPSLTVRSQCSNHFSLSCLCVCVCTLDRKLLLVKAELEKSISLYLEQKLVTSEVMQHTELQCTDGRAVSYPGSKYV